MTTWRQRERHKRRVRLNERLLLNVAYAILLLVGFAVYKIGDMQGWWK